MGAPTSAKPTPLRNSYWVIPGKVLAGEHPGASNREATRERLQRLLAAGVECFIDLTEPNEIKAYDRELPFSTEYLRKPLKDHSTPARRAHMAEILDCMHDALQSGRCVYVHCRAGIGRTGTVIGCFLVERGLAGEAALDELNRLWQHCERSHSWASIPETSDQTNYILRWKRRGIFDDRGGLTTPDLQSHGDDLRSGGGPGPWAHLLGNEQSNSSAPRPTPKSSRSAGSAGASPAAKGPSAGGLGAAAEGSAAGVSPVAAEDAPAGKLGAAAQGSAAGVSPGAAKDAPAGKLGAAAQGSAAGVSPGAAKDAPAGKLGAAAQGSVAGVPSTARGLAAGPFPASAQGPAARVSPAASGTPAGVAPSTRAQPSANGLPPAAPPPATAVGASRAAIANAARAAARESDGEELLTDPTSVSKLPQPQQSRPGVPGWIGRGSAPTVPTALNSAQPVHTPDCAPSGASAATSQASRPGASHDDASHAADERGDRSRTGTRDSARANAPATGATGKRPIGHGSAPRFGDAAPTNPTASTRLGNSGAFRVAENDPDVDPLLDDPEALSAASNLRGRFLGALIGLAIGDAVAAATQYRRPGSFTPVGDMLGGGPFDLPRGGWSDDTSMALCLADSLLERNGFDARDQMERYRRWQQEGYLSATGQCIGITASTARAIAMAQWRRQALFGSHDPSQQDPEPLSRVAAAVLFFFSTSGEAINQATEAARTTCQAPAVLDACRALARALYAALTGQPKATVLERAALAVTAPALTAGTGSPTGATSASGSGPVVSHREGSSAPAALAAAVAAFGATDNFRDAILYAVNLGGDSDVVASVCGQLAGAYYSVKAIPTSWYNGLMQKELITDYADRLLAHAMESLSG